MLQKLGRRALLSVALGLGLAATVLTRSASREPLELVSSVPDKPGVQVLAVFIGAMFCHAQEIPGFPEAIGGAKRGIVEQAKARDHVVGAMTVGIALDETTENGLSFLKIFGSFDQVIVGGGWLNAGAVEYVWKGLPGVPGIPQLLVIERDVAARDGSVLIGDSRLIMRLVGSQEILQWAKMGSVVPWTPTSPDSSGQVAFKS